MGSCQLSRSEEGLEQEVSRKRNADKGSTIEYPGVLHGGVTLNLNFRNFSLPCTRATEVNYRLLKILGEPKLRPKRGWWQ